MALELITSEQVIKNIALGGRVFDGGGLYLLAAKKSTGQHGWRFDYPFEGKRKTISLGTYPSVDLKMARERASEARKQVAAGINPSELRKQKRAVIVAKVEAERRVPEGLPAVGSFEDVARRWFETRHSSALRSHHQAATAGRVAQSHRQLPRLHGRAVGDEADAAAFPETW